MMATHMRRIRPTPRSGNAPQRPCARLSCRKPGLALYEPVMTVEVEIPTEFQGAVVGYFAKHRGAVTASEHLDEHCVIQAQAPLTELFDFANDFRSMTQGQGTFTMEFLAYQPAPIQVQEGVASKRKAATSSS